MRWRAAELPDRTDEGFEKTSVEEMFAPDFGLNPDRVAIAADIAATFRCDVPNLSSLLGLVVNDRFVPSATLLKNLPQGVTVCSLRRAALEMPSLVEEFYGRLAPVGLPGVALNSLLVQDGVFIHVPAGCALSAPCSLSTFFRRNSPLWRPGASCWWPGAARRCRC